MKIGNCKLEIKTIFLVLAFCLLFFAFSSTPTRAEVVCPTGAFPQEPDRLCCNYENSTSHIPDPSPLCFAEPRVCEKKSFEANPDGNTFGGPCNYCNPNVAKHGPACEDTCNWNCADPDEDDDAPPADFCPVPDYETDPCCPLEFSFNEKPSWLQAIFDALTSPLNVLFKATVALKNNKLEHAHVKELAEDYLGTPSQNYNDGVMTKLMPPNHVFIEEKAERVRVNDEWAKLEITVGSEGEEGEEKIIEGADWYPYKLDYATTFLASALTRIPGQEDSQTSLLREEAECEPAVIKLASAPTTGTVLAATDDGLCHDVLQGSKHSACVAEETSSAEISFTKALENVLSGKIKIYPRLSFLDKIYSQTVGPSGSFRIFDIPGEEHEEYDGEAESDLEIGISVSIPLMGDFSVGTFNVSSKENGKGIFHTGTEKVANDNIQQKLSLPGGED